MPDNKFIEKEDRMVVLDDFKKRIIDLMENTQALPEVDIYDEPVRYFKANEQWCKLIFGWLSWLEDVAGWQEAEDTNYSGIQQIIKFEEGIDPEMSIDYEAWYDANKRAIYDAVNDVAKQIVSGRTVNIAVGNDGAVTDPTTDGGEGGIPEDDPTTVDINEAAASAMGGAIAVCQAIEKIFDMLDTKYGTVNGSPLISESQMVGILHAYFPSDETLLAVGVTQYYTWRVGQPALNFNTSVAFQRYMYCKGYNKNAFNRWLIDLSGYAESRRVVYASVIEAMSQSFWDDYFAYGSKVGSTDYREASCTKIPTENWTYAMQAASVAYSISGFLKAGHRYQFDFAGSFTDVDNPNIVQDAFYSHNLTTGVKTYIGFTWNISGVTAPSAAQTPFKADHIYTVTVEKTGGDNSGILTKGNNFTTPANTVGSITAQMTDLGEFAL